MHCYIGVFLSPLYLGDNWKPLYLRKQAPLLIDGISELNIQRKFQQSSFRYNWFMFNSYAAGG